MCVIIFAIWFFGSEQRKVVKISYMAIFVTPVLTAKNNLFFKNHCFLFCGLKKSI